MGPAFSRQLLPGGAALRPAPAGSHGAGYGGPGGGTGPAPGGHPPHPVHGPGRLQGPRGPGLYCPGLRAGGSAPAPEFHRGTVFQDPGGNGGTLRRPARGPGKHGGNRQALQCESGAGQELPAPVPHAGRGESGRLPGQDRPGRPGSAPGPALPGPGGAPGPAPRVRRPPGTGNQHGDPDGVPGLLPHRGGLY